MKTQHRSFNSLTEVAKLFLKLGTIAFGGPAAHIAMMEDEVVRRRQWLSHAEFLDLLGATNLIPGPNSTEMAIHIGHRQAGWPGLAVAGCCFILPAMCIVTAFAWVYVRYGTLPEVSHILYGVKPVIIAVVLQALWGLSRSALKNTILVAISIIGSVLFLCGIHELLILFSGGLAPVVWRWMTAEKTKGRSHMRSVLLTSPLVSIAQASPSLITIPSEIGLWPLFAFFLKVGAVLYGSGYVLLAFLRADLVERWHWLSEAQLLDAIAVGQVTPGPVFTTATFIGYLLGGTIGAVVATVGIFLPAFVFVAISGPLIPRLRQSPVASAFLDGVNAASLALMAVVTYQLGNTALVDVTTVTVFAIGLVLLVWYRVNSAWLVLGGALVGWLAFAL